MNTYLHLVVMGLLTINLFLLSGCGKQESFSPVVQRNDPFFQEDRVVLPKNKRHSFKKATPAIQRLDTRDLNFEK